MAKRSRGKNPCDWDVDDVVSFVADCGSELKLDQDRLVPVLQSVRSQYVTGEVLVALTEEERKELIALLGLRVIVFKRLQGLIKEEESRRRRSRVLHHNVQPSAALSPANAENFMGSGTTRSNALAVADLCEDKDKNGMVCPAPHEFSEQQEPSTNSNVANQSISLQNCDATGVNALLAVTVYYEADKRITAGPRARSVARTVEDLTSYDWERFILRLFAVQCESKAHTNMQQRAACLQLLASLQSNVKGTARKLNRLFPGKSNEEAWTSKLKYWRRASADGAFSQVDPVEACLYFVNNGVLPGIRMQDRAAPFGPTSIRASTNLPGPKPLWSELQAPVLDLIRQQRAAGVPLSVEEVLRRCLELDPAFCGGGHAPDFVKSAMRWLARMNLHTELDTEAPFHFHHATQSPSDAAQSPLDATQSPSEPNDDNAEPRRALCAGGAKVLSDRRKRFNASQLRRLQAEYDGGIRGCQAYRRIAAAVSGLAGGRQVTSKEVMAWFSRKRIAERCAGGSVPAAAVALGDASQRSVSGQ